MQVALGAEQSMSCPDLSHVHGLISDLFQWPETPEEWARLRLTEQQIEDYHRDGYLAGIDLLTADQVDELREQLSRLTDPSHPGNSLFHEFHSNESSHPDTVLFHALGAWRIESGFHDLLWNPAFVMPASQLLGGPVRFWHDQLFCKPAQHGGVVAWHQDYSYWTRTVPVQHLTCWIALDDTDESNGAVNYIPGSHRWPLLPITGLAGDMEAIREVLTDEQWHAFSPVSVTLKRGQASFHHPLMVHGSRENRSDRPRRAAVLNAFRDGTLSGTDEPLLQQVPPVPKGQPITGQVFPLLFDPASGC